MKTFIRYERRYNKEYAYEVTPVKAPETGKWRYPKKYLGVVVDAETKALDTPYKNKYNGTVKQLPAVPAATPKAAVLDYGDSYFLNQLFCGLSSICALFGTFFGAFSDSVLALIFYRIIDGGAMMYADLWYSGNYVNLLFPKAKLSSQRISDLLNYLGDEELQQRFFMQYLAIVGKDTRGIVIDSTGLPNEINMSVTAWGHHGNSVDMQTRLIYAIDKDTGLPLAFRYIAGNIPDVSTLIITIKAMKRFGVNVENVLIDAGYSSETQIGALYEAGIDFCTRLSANFKVFDEIIESNNDIEDFKYAVKQNDQAYYVKEQEVCFLGKNAFAYLICNPIERARETSNAIVRAKSGEVPNTKNCGKFVLVSTKKVGTDEIVPLYHTRQKIEQLFGMAKSDLEILPLRSHSERNFSGFMFLSFLSLAILTQIKSKIVSKTMDFAFRMLRNLKCDVENGSAVPRELTKNQKAILNDSGVLLPNVLGI